MRKIPIKKKNPQEIEKLPISKHFHASKLKITRTDSPQITVPPINSIAPRYNNRKNHQRQFYHCENNDRDRFTQKPRLRHFHQLCQWKHIDWRTRNVKCGTDDYHDDYDGRIEADGTHVRKCEYVNVHVLYVRWCITSKFYPLVSHSRASGRRQFKQISFY